MYFENEKIINDVLVILTNIFDGGYFQDPNILPKARVGKEGEESFVDT